MWFVLPITLVMSSILQCGCAAPKEDLVTNLPGLSKTPYFKLYSGYLKGDTVGDKFLHYWFVESSSNPRTDPVVLWLNGGPGCSSVAGFLTEHGPYLIKSDGKTLRYNPFSWNQVANMIYLESPVGVGYSYSLSGDYRTNDSVVAIENTIAIKDFFEKFPELKANDFYLTGESYGGIYVPTLAAQILDIPSIKLKGFAVGNGVTSLEDNRNSLVYFVYYHGLIGDVDWDYLIKNCCPENGPKRCNFFKAAESDEKCASMAYGIASLVWDSGIDPYNMYKECDGGVNAGSSVVYSEKEGKFVTTYFGWPFSFLEKARNDKLKVIPRDKLILSVACSDFMSITAYMNSQGVRKALHIPGRLGQWEVCSSTVSQNYTKIYSTVASFYEKALSHKLRLMVYNGDIDMVCNFLGDEWFVDRLPLQNASKRRMWHYRAGDGTKQVAGFIKTFDRMSLVTVKGSGHMVPTDKPRPALELFINFIQDRPFQ